MSEQTKCGCVPKRQPCVSCGKWNVRTVPASALGIINVKPTLMQRIRARLTGAS